MIEFNRALMWGPRHNYMQKAIENWKTLGGRTVYQRNVQTWMKKTLSYERSAAHHRMHHALEMAAYLAELIQPGDEVIMPSHTFVSTADAFVSGSQDRVR